MSSPGDMSIRPAAPAELPAVARVADRDERQRREPHPREEKKKSPTHDQAGDEPRDETLLPRSDDGAGGTIDLMA